MNAGTAFSEETLSANLAALERAQGYRPPFAALDAASARAVADPVHGLRVEIKAADNEWWPLDGADPVALATAQAASQSGAEAVMLVGPGLGYLLDALERANTQTKVIALEPDPGTAVLFLARRDWRNWFESGRLRVLTGPDYVGASACSRIVNADRPPAILVNPALERHRPAHGQRARAVAERIIAEALSNAEARRQFAGRYLLQSIGNLPVIGRESNVSALQNAFRDRPAIVVGAGPSLDRNVEAIAAHSGQAVIVAADTALRPLLAGGVRPHIVVGVDPAEVNSRHLAGTIGTDDTWLAAEGSLHPAAFSSFGGRTFVFKVSDHEPWPWLQTLGIERATLRAWGSVVTSAFDLAVRMGCNPIIFSGLDLAYTDHRPYCSHTIFDAQWLDWKRDWGLTQRQSMDLVMQRTPILDVPDVCGGQAQTASHLVAFRNWLVENTTLAAQHLNFVNATGAGILAGPRINQQTLTEALRGAPALTSVVAQLRRRHAEGCTESSALRGGVEGVLGSRQAAANPLLERWSRFTADTVSADDMCAALAAVVSALP